MNLLFFRNRSTHIHYGIDVPGVTGVFLILALILTGLGFFLGRESLQYSMYGFFASAFFLSAFFFLWIGFALVWSAVRGKKKAAHQLIQSLQLKGKETLLDAGCGPGLVLIEAARKFRKGHYVGLDNWSQSIWTENSRERTLLNAKHSGVSSQVKVITGNMIQMPFKNASFDVVLSHFALHRLKSREARKKAVMEMTRVLKKGGRLAVQDFQFIHQTLETLKNLNFKDIQVSNKIFSVFPPATRILARKK